MINNLNQCIDYLLAPPHPPPLPFAAKTLFILNREVFLDCDETDWIAVWTVGCGEET
jgi:hypothetical protein